MVVIGVDVSELRQLISHLGALTGYQDELRVQVNAQATNLSGSWSGQAYTDYVAQNNRWANSAAQMNERLETLVGILSHSADQYDDVQARVADGQGASGPIKVDTAAYVAGANALMSAQARVGEVSSSLSGGLSGCGQMAGDDDAGKQWSSQYDEAAKAVLAAFPDAQTAVGAWGVRFVDTANAWENAENAISNGASPAGSAVYTGTNSVGAGAVPSAGGGGLGWPSEWEWLSEALQGVWPTADTGKLKAAGEAWNSAASALDSLASDVQGRAAEAINNNTAAEVKILTEGVGNVGEQFTQLAGYCRELGEACNSYADEVDAAHEALGAAVIQFIAETAAIAGISIIAGAVSFGAGAAIGAGAMAVRVTTFGARLVPLVARLSALGARIAGLTGRISSAATRVGNSFKQLGAVQKINTTASRAPGWLKATGAGVGKVTAFAGKEVAYGAAFNASVSTLANVTGMDDETRSNILTYGAAAFGGTRGLTKGIKTGANRVKNNPGDGTAYLIHASTRPVEEIKARALREAAPDIRPRIVYTQTKLKDRDPYGYDDATGRPLTKKDYDKRYMGPAPFTETKTNAYDRYPAPGKEFVPGTKNTYTGSAEITQMIQKHGSIADRIGYPRGEWLGAPGPNGPATIGERGLPVSSYAKPYYQYRYNMEKIKNLPEGWSVEVSQAGPAAGHQAGATQIQFFLNGEVQSVEKLIDKKIIKELPLP